MKRTFVKNNNRGYTLVELIIVIMIIAILAGSSIIGFSVYRDSDVESSAQKLTVILNKARQAAIIYKDGSVVMKLYQDTDDAYYASAIYNDGTSDKELYKNKIAGSQLKVSVKEDNGTVTTTYMSRNASVDPAMLTASQKVFHFKKSTGGYQEDYTDIMIAGSKTIDIIVIKETGRSYID